MNKETYISFAVLDEETKIKFQFIDSFRFLGNSLDTLSSSFQPEKISILVRDFPHLDPDRLKLLMRKGIFFYGYLDSVERLNETQLSSQEYFYNKLNDELITDSHFQHAQLIWSKFNLGNLSEYSDLCMKTDILLLVLVFETLRKSSHEVYGLHPAHYYTLSGYNDPRYRFTQVLRTWYSWWHKSMFQ